MSLICCRLLLYRTLTFASARLSCNNSHDSFSYHFTYKTILTVLS